MKENQPPPVEELLGTATNRGLSQAQEATRGHEFTVAAQQTLHLCVGEILVIIVFFFILYRGFYTFHNKYLNIPF